MMQDFWGITTFFNPAGYGNKLENYKKFRDSSKKQGLKLLTVELAFGERSFELSKNDADILIQLRTKEENALWQKESLLNIGLRSLPMSCDNFAWLDCDIIFDDENWIEKANLILEKYSAVQLFSHIVMLKKEKPILSESFNQKDRLAEIDKHYSKKNVFHSTAYTAFLNDDKQRRLFSKPGGAWASKKSIFDQFGFYDKTILGGGDCLMLAGLYSGIVGNKNTKEQYKKSLLSRKTFSDYDLWYKKISEKVGGNIFYLDGIVFHLWHGERKNRFYEARQMILKKYDFDHNEDIKKDENGVWEWASNKKILHEIIKRYFFARNETGLSSWKSFVAFLGSNHISPYFWRDEIFLVYLEMKIKCLRADIRRSVRPIIDFIKSQNFSAKNINIVDASAKPIYVCTSVDMNQVEYFPTMANSISKNTKSPVILYLLARDFSAEVKDKILNLNLPNIKINIIKMDEYFKDIDFRLPSLICHTSKSAMDRNLLPSILPNIKKIIYLDIDLVVNADLTSLYKMETPETGICARSCVSRRYETMEKQLKAWGVKKEDVINCLPSHKINMNAKCLNSGVMVLDLDKLRKNNFEQMSLYLIKNFIFSFHDQLLFNIYVNGEYRELPDYWNVFVGQIQPEKKNIIHWVGPKKPWNEKVILGKYWDMYYLPFNKVDCKSKKSDEIHPKINPNLQNSPLTRLK